MVVWRVDMEEYYLDALKLGKTGYKQAKQKGEDPYLAVLDEILPASLIHRGVDIGYGQVPLNLIVGTKTRGRQNDFAKNFMPLQDPRSEFAYKWNNLCESHLEEGIRDPILVWEYMNRFYVQEGNKRVSVLKFFDGYEIPSQIKRIYPIDDGSDEVKLYYELLNFKKISRIQDLEFTRLGSYVEFQALVGKEKDEKWSDDDLQKFRGLYYRFEKAYKKYGGNQLNSTVGDALLACARIYGYHELYRKGEQELYRSLVKVWKEVKLQEQDQQIEVKLEPGTEGKNIFSNRILLKKKKVAFVYGDKIELSGWRKNHEIGREHIQSALSNKIETKVYIVDENPEATLRKAIGDGASIVFVPEVNLLKASLKVAVEYPSVKIFNCSLNKPYKFIHTYYPRMYEAKFITGAIAGALTNNNRIGYICKYPIYGTIAEINAFARGVQLTNPKAMIYLEWSSKEGILAAENKLKEKGAQLISYREYGNAKEEENKRFGLAFVDGNEISPVVLPIWNWTLYYERIIQSILDGSFDFENEKTDRSLNYYWGISSGVIDLMYSEQLPNGIRYLGQTLFTGIENGDVHPFYTMDDNANGTYRWDRVKEYENIETIMNMDDLEENIVGYIPTYDELDQQVQDVVDDLGVTSSRKDRA